jgi:hypothetical protein
MLNKKHLELPSITDAAEAKIKAGIASDPDNSEWTKEDFQ